MKLQEFKPFGNHSRGHRNHIKDGLILICNFDPFVISPIEKIFTSPEVHMLSSSTVGPRIYLLTYIEVQNQVKYGGNLNFFSSRCFRKLLNTYDQRRFWESSFI